MPDLDQLTQEIRIASEGEARLGWLAGIFYFEEELAGGHLQLRQLGAPAIPRMASRPRSRRRSRTPCSESVTIRRPTAGTSGALRYLQRPEGLLGRASGRALFQPSDVHADRAVRTDDDNVSWDASATYKAAPNVNVYGRVATSFRAPSIQGRILFCPDFAGGLDPSSNCVSVGAEEQILSEEIGIKTELLERTLRLNLTAFNYDVDDQQITVVGGAGNIASIVNADTVNGYGLEADVEWAPNATWVVNTSASYNHTEIDDPNLAVNPCGGGCTVRDPFVTAIAVSVDGDRLPQSPEWIWNGIIDFRNPMGDGIFVGSLDWAYSSEKRFFIYQSEEFNSDSLEFGARLGYAFSEARYEVALFGRNLTDEEIIQNGIDFNNLTGMMNDPRTVGIELLARF